MEKDPTHPAEGGEPDGKTEPKEQWVPPTPPPTGGGREGGGDHHPGRETQEPGHTTPKGGPVPGGATAETVVTAADPTAPDGKVRNSRRRKKREHHPRGAKRETRAGTAGAGPSRRTRPPAGPAGWGDKPDRPGGTPPHPGTRRRTHTRGAHRPPTARTGPGGTPPGVRAGGRRGRELNPHRRFWRPLFYR